MLRFIRDNTFLDSPNKPEFFLYLILLNRPFERNIFLDLYNKATIFICADGGTNRLFDSFTESERYLSIWKPYLSITFHYRCKILPHIIIGDMDSIRPEVKEYYEEKGVKIFYNKDQDTTDLEKCVYYVFENSESLTKYEKKDSPKNVLM